MEETAAFCLVHLTELWSGKKCLGAKHLRGDPTLTGRDRERERWFDDPCGWGSSAAIKKSGMNSETLLRR